MRRKIRFSKASAYIELSRSGEVEDELLADFADCENNNERYEVFLSELTFRIKHFTGDVEREYRRIQRELDFTKFKELVTA